MKLIVLDFETYFDDAYTLKKMTTEAYIRDPRFEALGVGLRRESGELEWIEADNIQAAFDAIDWTRTAVLAHHAHFDGLILNHHYNVKPAFWFDTLSMGRLKHGNSIGLGLGSLASYYNLSEKSVPYDLFRGRRWRDLDRAVRIQLADGCLQDVALTWGIFKRLSDGFPSEEFRVIDQTVRFFTEPRLEGDIQMLERLRQEEWDNKNTRLIRLGVTAAQLQSADQFVKLLEAEDIEVEMKAGKNGPIPAIAATDQFMRDLEGSSNERASELVAARLEVRSTIDETRSARLAGMASRGALAVYLNYCGAATLRWSGGDKVNFQNFRRGGAIRKALKAPKGYAVGVVDLSQIECRVLNYVAGQWDALEAFKAKRDLYSEIASRFYRKPVSKETPAERGLGKQMILSCGYGSGAQTFVNTARRGSYGPPIELTLAEGKDAVETYRKSYARIPAYWRQGDEVLKRMSMPQEARFEWGCMEIVTGPAAKIIVPNGAWMNYQLEWDAERGSMKRKTRQGWRKIWGGVVAQNVCEALSRLILSQAMLRITKGGVRIVGCTHDELVFIEKECWIKEAYEFAVEEMTREVPWLPGIPLDAEGGYGERYSK